MSDLFVHGARRLDGSPVEVSIADGTIVATGESLSAPAGAEVIDAQGWLLLPGALDTHVHFNAPGARAHWEGWDTGSDAAAAGGITAVAEMPLNALPPTLDADAVRAKAAAAAAQSRVDFALWGGVVPGNRGALAGMARAGVLGFKAFMSASGIDDFPAADDLTLYEAMATIAPLGLPLLLHAESDTITSGLTVRARAEGRTGVRDYLASRPPVAETEAIARALELAAVTGCRLHIVHVSSARGLALIRAARERGGDVSGEVTAHHLVLCDADAEALGARAKCAPPLRPRGEVDALWAALAEDPEVFVVSDHSPAPAELKEAEDAFAVWGGIAGVQSTVELIVEAVLLAGRAAPARLPDLLAGAAARRFGLSAKGRLEPGMDGDLCLVEVGPARRLERDELRDRHRLSPYVGRELRARVRRTILRGAVIAADGRPVGPPRGRALAPATPVGTGPRR